MFTKKTYADIKKSTLKIQDSKKDSFIRLKHLKTILDFIDVNGAKSLFETNYSHVFFILYDTFLQAEVNLKHKDLSFQIVHKTNREELESSLWLLKKILTLLPELLGQRWQCHSLSRIMAKLLHLGNSPWLRREGVRYFILWYQVLGENAPNYVHEMFADLFPGLVVPQKVISVADGEYDPCDVFNHPNMNIELGTSVFHDMMLHPVQNLETVAIFLPSASDRSGPLDPIESLEVFLNCMVEMTGSIKWRDNCSQKVCQHFVFLLNRFKEVFIPVFCPDFDNTNTIYEPNLTLPTMRTVNRKDGVMSSCVVVLINWISRFVHEKIINSKADNIYFSYAKSTGLLSDNKSMAHNKDLIIRDALYSTQSNINFIHEVLRQGFLLGFTTKSQIDAMRTSVAIYRDWMTSKNPPPFMLETNDGDNNSSSCTSIDSSYQNQNIKSSHSTGTVETHNSIQAGLQNIIKVFVTNAANVFLINTNYLNIVFPSSNKEFQSTPLNEQTDICKKVLNVYRTMVMNSRMDPKTWEQLLLVLLRITSIVLKQNPVGSRPGLGSRLGQAIFQTLIVTWIRAHTNVPINVQLWERFLNVLTSFTHKDALINEWEKTMQTLTRVLGRYVYNLNLQDLPLDRMVDNKGKRRRIASVWQSEAKERSSRSAQILNERNVEVPEEQKKKEELNSESVNRIVTNTSNLCRCYSEGSLGPRKLEEGAHNKKRNVLGKPSSFYNSFNALLDPTNQNMSYEKLSYRNEDSMTLFKESILRRTMSLNSFHLKNAYSTGNRDDESIHDSRNPSPSASSGIEGVSIKDSPMQIDTLIADTVSFEENSWVTASERRSIILGGCVSGWLPGTAAIMWKRMLCSLGDINLISRPELHAQVFKYLVEMTRNLIKIMHNQGVSEDNLSTPTPPSLVPPIGISGPWCYGAQLLGPEYKKGKLLAIKIVSMLALHGSISGRKHMSLFYNLLHSVFTGEERQWISSLFKYIEGTRFLSLQLPGHTLLLLDIVHASAVLLTSNDPNHSSCHGEVVTLLGSLLCYPASAIPKLFLQPSMQQIELTECPDLHDHILNIMLRCARREQSSKGRCIAFAQLGQWICLELNRPNIHRKRVKQSSASHQNGEVEHPIAFNPRIKEVVQVLLQALRFKHRTIAVVAAGSLKICSDQGNELSEVDNLPQIIITSLCKALEVQLALFSHESDKLALSTLMLCLGEFCMSLPVNCMLDEPTKKGISLIIAVLRVMFQILSGEQQNNSVDFLHSDSDFDESINIDDVIVGKFNNEVNYQKSKAMHWNKMSVQLCAKSVIMHLVAHLGLFPPSIGASRLNTLVEEQDDIYIPKITDGREPKKYTTNSIESQSIQSQIIAVFILNTGIIASFIELPDFKQQTGSLISGLKVTEKQIRVLLRDLNGKSCWEASILYNNPKKLHKNFIASHNFRQSNSDLQSQNYESSGLFYSLKLLNEEVLKISRYTMRHRPCHTLPDATDLAPDLDQLGDLLQYVGYISPECFNSSTQINIPGLSSLGWQLEAQTISILLNQRSNEQKYEANLHNFLNDKEQNVSLLLQQTFDQSFESYNATNMYKSKYHFQICRLLFSHLGLIGWERRSRTYLLQRSEQLKREFRNMDIQKCRDTHKVAVVYVASGQEDKNSILTNTYGSSAYESFVSALGWEIDLETHNGFLGGLPRQGCGATSPYYATPFVEVIYHTATRMPSDTPEALLTKTRHLGNDEVHIVWSEHHREYRRDILPTEFCDVLIVVYPLKNSLYRVTVNWKPDIPWFGPLANESVVNGSCLATLVRETAINASRSKRSSLSLYQQYYEERNRSLENVSTLYKENSTFEEFADRVYSTNHITLLGESSLGVGCEQLNPSFIDKHCEKGLV